MRYAGVFRIGQKRLFPSLFCSIINDLTVADTDHSYGHCDNPLVVRCEDESHIFLSI